MLTTLFHSGLWELTTSRSIKCFHSLNFAQPSLTCVNIYCHSYWGRVSRFHEIEEEKDMPVIKLESILQWNVFIPLCVWCYRRFSKWSLLEVKVRVLCRNMFTWKRRLRLLQKKFSWKNDGEFIQSFLPWRGRFLPRSYHFRSLKIVILN